MPPNQQRRRYPSVADTSKQPDTEASIGLEVDGGHARSDTKYTVESWLGDRDDALKAWITLGGEGSNETTRQHDKSLARDSSMFQ